jgi:hypothetical protein
MKIPTHLLASGVADKPLDYKWDVKIQNRFLAADADSKPALASAIGKISTKAAFAFAVACAEWIAVRLSHRTDVADALLRVDAAWAATLDPHYASLPEPKEADPDNVDPAADPVHIAMMLLSDLHERYSTERASDVYLDALILAMLAEHVAGRNPVFKRWVPEVLKRAHAHYPKSAKPPTKELNVAREVFFPDAPDKATLGSALTNLRAAIKAAKNPYLTAAARKS